MSINRFEEKDFERAQLYPGAVLCFCTFNESLEPAEIKGLKKIVEAAREILDVGVSVNPVLILTGRELFGQFHFGDFSDLYGADEQMARGMCMRGETRDLCEFHAEAIRGHAVKPRGATREDAEARREKASKGECSRESSDDFVGVIRRYMLRDHARQKV